MQTRFAIVAVVALLAVAACSNGGSNRGGAGTGLDATTTAPAAESAACKKTTLTAPEIGVTDTSITITAIADVQNAFRPGLFKGSWEGIKAWADYVNANGGLACRKIIVKVVDSHLTADDSKAAIAQACLDSFATVGTTALFLSDVSGMNRCKDRSGVPTGLPDVALLQSDPAHQCSPVSFAALPTNSACPYRGTRPRAFGLAPTQYDYFASKYGADLHAVFVVPKDTPSTISAAMPVFRGYNKLGVKSDAEFGMSALASQSQYTPVVQAIKQHKSNFVLNMLDYKGSVLLRKEAVNQGASGLVKVWHCFLNCYDERLISEGGSAVEGQYVWLTFLPIEDKGANPELDAFLQYDKNPDGWGMQAWIAGEIFARAVSDAVASHNNDPNAITRANLLAALRDLHDFDANGMSAQTDVGNRAGSSCVVGMQVQKGKFVRVDPPTPGTFDCDNNKPLVTLTIDPVKEFHG